jgi:hypothetical protein
MGDDDATMLRRLCMENMLRLIRANELSHLISSTMDAVDGGVAQVCSALERNTSVLSFNLLSTKRPAADWALIVRTLLWTNITELGDALQCDATDEELDRLLTIAVTNAARLLRNNDSRIVQLSYAATCISGRQLKPLFDALPGNTHLSKLSLGENVHNPLHDCHVAPLLQIIPNTHITMVDIKDGSVSMMMQCKIVEAAIENGLRLTASNDPALTALDWSFDSGLHTTNDDVITRLSASLHGNTHLQDINLSFTSFGKGALRKLIDAIPTSAVTHVDMMDSMNDTDGFLSEEDWEQIDQMLDELHEFHPVPFLGA